MNFPDYIKGNRKGADARRIEKDSMKDPFLYEAIEGFDSIDDDHMERIGNIHKRLNLRSRTMKHKKNHYHMWQISAASVAAVLIFVAGGYFYNSNYQANHLYSENTGSIGNDDIIKIYVPQEYYTENVVVIARHNAEAVKSYTSSGINKQRTAKQDTEIVETAEIPSPEPREILNVYIPE
jgi:hypothetical protein